MEVHLRLFLVLEPVTVGREKGLGVAVHFFTPLGTVVDLHLAIAVATKAIIHLGNSIDDEI